MFPARKAANYACLRRSFQYPPRRCGETRQKGLMSEFFDMGGYAGYVWPAYIASALAIGGLIAAIWLRGRALKKRLTKAEAARKAKEDA